MPAGPRVRGNNSFGVTTNNPLAIGDLTLNSLQLPTLPAVSSAHAIITLDPLRTNGEPEIIVVTAHGAGATSATITRAAYGTAARSHPQGTVWVHAPVTEDVVPILTSGTRPTDPYRGQLIFETDTNSYVGRDTSDAWQTAVPLGAWQSYTPTFTNLTVGSGALSGGFTRFGRTIHYYVKWTFGAGSAVGSNPTFSLPVAASSRYSSSVLDQMGRGIILDSGTADFDLVSLFSTSTTAVLQVLNATGTYTAVNGVTATVPMTWAAGDSFVVQGTYEAAS